MHGMAPSTLTSTTLSVQMQLLVLEVLQLHLDLIQIWGRKKSEAASIAEAASTSGTRSNFHLLRTFNVNGG